MGDIVSFEREVLESRLKRLKSHISDRFAANIDDFYEIDDAFSSFFPEVLTE